MLARKLWHEDLSAWDQGQKRAKEPTLIHSPATPVTMEEVDSESDDDELDDIVPWD